MTDPWPHNQPASVDDLARLRVIAEDPLARPSERVAARRQLAETGERPRRLCGNFRGEALAVARAILDEMGFE